MSGGRPAKGGHSMHLGVSQVGSVSSEGFSPEVEGLPLPGKLLTCQGLSFIIYKRES